MNVKVQDAEVDTEVDAEEKGFNAAIDSLVPEAAPNPLTDVSVDESDVGTENVVAGEETSTEDEAEKIPVFLGDMTADQVLAQLGKIDGMEEAIYDKVSQKVFGKFGEIGNRLKALQEREFKFDPDKLAKLREVDPGIAEALSEDLTGAFSGQSFDQEAVADSLRQSIVGDINPYVEQRLLTALVEDAGTIVKSEEFSSWFFDHASQGVRDTFAAWDDHSQMDGVKMANAFGQFATWKSDKADAKNVKEDKLSRSVESSKSGAKPPAARQMSEEEAFNSRINETRK